MWIITQKNHRRALQLAWRWAEGTHLSRLLQREGVHYLLLRPLANMVSSTRQHFQTKTTTHWPLSIHHHLKHHHYLQHGEGVVRGAAAVTTRRPWGLVLLVMLTWWHWWLGGDVWCVLCIFLSPWMLTRRYYSRTTADSLYLLFRGLLTLPYYFSL